MTRIAMQGALHSVRMKKGQICEGIIEKMEFPNKGIMHVEDTKVIVKNALPGQKISCMLSKKRSSHFEGRLLEVLDEGELGYTGAACGNVGVCGGCLYTNRRYEDTVKVKEQQIRELLDDACLKDAYSSEYIFEGVIASPVSTGYRNKMEFTFGDSYKDGPLALGLHKRGSMYDIVNTCDCMIAPEAMNIIMSHTLDFMAERGIRYYHKMSHIGYLRHLLVRQSAKYGEILVALVTSSQYAGDEARMLSEYCQMLLECKLEEGCRITGIVHIVNDGVADAVIADRMELLYGVDYIHEDLLGLRFKITPFSFFQTNSKGAEVLYSKVREYIANDLGDKQDRLVYDLYSGTGTIAQVLAPVASKVIGVEIVEEAVVAARENAAYNGLGERCQFLAGDVLKVLDTIKERPDCIILDPPRDGVHPKALPKILSYGVEHIVYISCKATSLVRDLETIHAYGYYVTKACAVDMFPFTGGIETVCLLSKVGNQKTDSHVELNINMENTRK